MNKITVFLLRFRKNGRDKQLKLYSPLPNLQIRQDELFLD